MKIVKLSQPEADLIVAVVNNWRNGYPLSVSQSEIVAAILSKLDSAVVEDHRDVPPEKASESGCMSEP